MAIIFTPELRAVTQDVLARLDYHENWQDFLAQAPGDSIQTSTWAVNPAGLNLSDAMIADGFTAIWASGGVPGVTYRVSNVIVTAQGRQDVRYFSLTVADGAAMPEAPARTALFVRPQAVEAFKSSSLAFLDNSFPVDGLSDDAIWEALVQAEYDAAHELRVLFEPHVIIPEDAPDDEVAALVAAGTKFKQESAYDYDPQDWSADCWGYTILRQRPVQSVESVKFTYPQPNNTVLDVPHDWLRLDKKYGHLRFVPTGTLMGMGPLASYLMQAMSSGRLIPNMIHIRYTAGLANPARDFPELVGLVKRMAVLRILKASFLPQSTSISADGLSQSASVDTGKWQDEIDRDLGVLRDAIHGIRMMAF